MQIVLGLIGLCLIGFLVFVLCKDNKIESELKREQLKYYQRFNELCEKEEKENDDN